MLLAVSGGADSVALLRAMRALKSEGPGRLAVAHFNHRLRGERSDADARFVAALCQGLDLNCTMAVADDLLANTTGDGLEAAARAARYEFLRTTAEQSGARYLVTAHTVDDQAETILHHVLRGTGLAGLAGMHATRVLSPAVTLVRPMLDITRDEVLAYLGALGQEYREDPMNRDLQFTRNRIRHELLPLVKREYSPSVVESLVRLGNLAADANRVIEAAALELLETCLIESSAAGVSLDCRPLAGQDRHLVREMLIAVWQRQGWPLQAMGFAQWDSLAGMALAQEQDDAKLRAQMFPGAITAQRQAERLMLDRSDASGQMPEAGGWK